MAERSLKIAVSERIGEVSAILDRPDDASLLYVLAHGAGAGMNHLFMTDIAERLAAAGVATLRYNFPFTEKGKRRPDYKTVLLVTIRKVVEKARELAPDLPIVAGGKSMGGRMTSQQMANEPMESVEGLVFVGFPLHAPGRDTSERGDHLFEVRVPMLFLQGTRDKLAKMELVEPLCEKLGDKATLHIVDGADHGFKVLKRSGRTHDEVMAELSFAIMSWAGDEFFPDTPVY
jgi:predicted alpha/beta-hydrolase family hydrolase